MPPAGYSVASTGFRCLFDERRLPLACRRYAVQCRYALYYGAISRIYLCQYRWLIRRYVSRDARPATVCDALFIGRERMRFDELVSAEHENFSRPNISERKARRSALLMEFRRVEY